MRIKGVVAGTDPVFRFRVAQDRQILTDPRPNWPGQDGREFVTPQTAFCRADFRVQLLATPTASSIRAMANRKVAKTLSATVRVGRDRDRMELQ